MDDDHEVSPGLQRAIEETRAAIEASFDGGDAAQPKIRCLIDQLKADLARVDLLPWDAEGFSKRNAARIVTAPDANGNRHTVAKVPKTTHKINAFLLMRAVNALPLLIARIEELEAALSQAAETARTWQPIETAPKDQMFIWAAPKGDGTWGLGLAYRNVSGGWSDAYGGDAPERATHWMPLPEPPKGE